MFTSLKPFKSCIKFVDGRELQVKVVGLIEEYVHSNDERIKIKIDDVLIVPEMRINLISIGKLTKKGFLITFDKGGCEIKLNKKVITKCKSSKQNSNLYQLKLFSNNSEMSLATMNNSDTALATI